MSGSGGVSTVVGAGGSVYVTTGGSDTIFGSRGGNDTVESGGTDTIALGRGDEVVFASGPAATIYPGVGSLLFVAGGGDYVLNPGNAGAQQHQTIYGGSGADDLRAGGEGSVLVAGSGNTTLSGGFGGLSVLYGGPGTDTLESLGTDEFPTDDTLVGGTGNTRFEGGAIAFGGPDSNDVFTPFATTIVEGNGREQVDIGLSSGAATVFGGKGVDTYYLNSNFLYLNPDFTTTGTLIPPKSIIGFKTGDVVAYDLEDGSSLSTALATEVKGSFGSTVVLNGASLTFFGHVATAADFEYVTRNMT